MLHDKLNLTARQKELRKLCQKPESKLILAYGGSGSAKSFGLIKFILDRALIADGSRHVIYRRHRVDAQRTVFDNTLKKVFNEAFPAQGGRPSLWDTLSASNDINRSNLTVNLPNGSFIKVGHIDPNDLDAVLGDEWNTIYIDECSQIMDYTVIERLRNRLRGNALKADGNHLSFKFFLSCNPPSPRHWTKKVFIDKVHPDTNKPLARPETYKAILLSPEHNKEHLPDDYWEQFESASKAHRDRFLLGKWSDGGGGGVFDLDWVNAERTDIIAPINADFLSRIVVAIDPAASTKKGSDETGIIVVGKDDDGKGYVLEDLSGKYTPDEWATKALDAYKRWKADHIIAERNMGGDMVANTIRMIDASAPVKTIHASRGINIRAEPIAALYKRGLIRHAGVYDQLEDQMNSFKIDHSKSKDGSPDRLDAMVHGFSELFLDAVTPRGGGTVIPDGFWSS